MPLELVTRFYCDSCGVIVEGRQVAACPPMPANIALNGVALPQGWERTEDGKVACVQHARLVQPVAVVPNLRAIHGKIAGRA